MTMQVADGLLTVGYSCCTLACIHFIFLGFASVQSIRISLQESAMQSHHAGRSLNISSHKACFSVQDQCCLFENGAANTDGDRCRLRCVSVHLGALSSVHLCMATLAFFALCPASLKPDYKSS